MQTEASGRGAVIGSDEYRELQDLIYETSGMYFSWSRHQYILQKVGLHMSEMGVDDFAGYMDALRHHPAHMTELFNQITINETFFYRDKPQIDAFSRHLVPQVIRSGSPLRVLSAGCSSGEELYTLSMEMQLHHPGLQLDFLGVDLSARVLGMAREGIYGPYALRQVPETARSRFFAPLEGERWQVGPTLRQGVRFESMNILQIEDHVQADSLDVVFCRYVMIYFDQRVKEKVVASLFRLLRTGGYLILGNAESLFGVSDAFRLYHYPGALIYRKEGDV